MIVILDDDSTLLEIMKTLLQSEGHTVHAFTEVASAMSWLRGNPPPDLIISDIVLPDQDGFDFRRAVMGLPSLRSVPFIFISSLADEETVVRGLDEGGGHYLTKPILPGIFRAKVRAVLRTSAQKPTPTFRGDLSKLSFPQLFQFCESKGLTGTVTITANDFRAELPFKGGELDYAVLENADTVLDSLYELASGEFCIAQKIASFSEIRSSQVLTPIAPGRQLSEKPMGVLSGVQVGEKLLQVQTEYTDTPSPAIVTIVVYDGRTIHKKVDEQLPDFTKDGVSRQLRLQHSEVEAQIRTKLTQGATANSDEEQRLADFTRLFDKGLEHYMAKEYPEALQYWTQAHELNPDHKLLNINMGVLKKKMG